MKMKKMLAFVLALAMLAGMLTGCGSAQTSAVSAEQASSASVAEQTAAPASEAPAAPAAEESDVEAARSMLEGSAAEIGAEAAAAADGAQLAQRIEGTPWDDTQIIGNLPEEQPAADEDFYTYCDYDFLEANQDASKDNLAAGANGIDEKILACITDESEQSALLDQFRILYEQAMDTDSQLTQGLAEVQTYLDMINACETLDEFSALLASDDFPFNPFLTMSVGPNGNGMDGNNIVGISTNFLFDDGFGAQVYHDTTNIEDPTTWSTYLSYNYQVIALDIMAYQGSSETMENDLTQMVFFENDYGQYAAYTGMYEDVAYGTMGDYCSYLSMDELAELAGNFPIREILTKYGCDSSESYAIQCSDWLKEFGAIYNEENLPILKNIAAAQIDKECQKVLWYVMSMVQKQLTGADPADITEEEIADGVWTAISGAKLLSNEIGSYYLDNLAGEDQARLTTMVENIRDSYAEMVQNCDWIDDTTREAILEKLDAMQMNILQPEGGYDDYSDLQLVSTEEGGTLFSNYLLLKDYNWQKEAARIGKAADSKAVWYSQGASTVNAFYDPDSNSINIVPGFLSDSTYTADMTDTEMYAAIGTVVGHEISHAFDVNGSQYDANGLPNTFFSEDDQAEYLEKVSALEDYFSSIMIAEGVNVNGSYVSPEATADLCGIRSALSAAEKLDPQMDYTVFFETYANMWSTTQDSETVQLILSIDNHNLNYIRVNADCQMMDEFYDTYDVNEGDNMYLDEDARLTFWW